MQIEDLQNEYQKTKTELNDFRMLLGKSILDTRQSNLFMQRLQNKLQVIKQYLFSQLQEEGIKGASST